MAKKNNTIYSVEDYLTMLRLSKRSERTISGYRKILKSYADFIGVPLDQVHNHLSVSSLLKYAASRQNHSDQGTKTNLSVLHRYFAINGIDFDELQYNAMRPKVTKEYNDKPLSTETLQKMFDLTGPHGRAFLSFMISTGCRASEACSVLLSDVNGDVVTIRNETAKNRQGGKVYLTAEAREYLDHWLKVRDNHILIADKRSVGLVQFGAKRPVNDQRLFAMSYSSANGTFSQLYDKVDGEKGKYHRKCTIHSCRKYFRTHAAKGMHPDLVTGIMRQTGYMDSTYVRMTDEDRRKQFHDGEHALYITRTDQREVSLLRKDHARLEEMERESAITRKILERVLSKVDGH
jgi:integrase